MSFVDLARSVVHDLEVEDAIRHRRDVIFARMAQQQGRVWAHDTHREHTMTASLGHVVAHPADLFYGVPTVGNDRHTLGCPQAALRCAIAPDGARDALSGPLSDVLHELARAHVVAAESSVVLHASGPVQDLHGNARHQAHTELERVRKAIPTAVGDHAGEQVGEGILSVMHVPGYHHHHSLFRHGLPPL